MESYLACFDEKDEIVQLQMVKKRVERDKHCLLTCNLDENNNQINHLQNDFNDESVTNKSVIPEGEKYIRYSLSKSNPGVSSNLHFNSHPETSCYKDKDTKSLRSVKKEKRY